MISRTHSIRVAAATLVLGALASGALALTSTATASASPAKATATVSANTVAHPDVCGDLKMCQ
jgi:hypothetical protein